LALLVSVGAEMLFVEVVRVRGVPALVFLAAISCLLAWIILCPRFPWCGGTLGVAGFPPTDGASHQAFPSIFG